MFAKLSHIFPYGTSANSDVEKTPTKEKSEKRKLAGSGEDKGKSVPAFETNLASSYSGPSNVSWLNDPRLSHAASAPIIGRSASSPLSYGAPANQNRIFAHNSLKSTRSLRLDYHRPSTGSGGSSLLPHTQSLSPIREQFSPERQALALPPIRPAQETHATDDHATPNSPAHSQSSSLFITRPLKKSVSQGSNITFGSGISTAAPSIPPVDLRPPFVIPPYSNYRTDKCGPVNALPTIAGSVRKNSEEDGDMSSMRTASYVTAPTVYTYASSSPSLLTQIDNDEHGQDQTLVDEEVDLGLTGTAIDGDGNRRSGISSNADADAEMYHLSLAVEPGTPSVASSRLSLSHNSLRTTNSVTEDRSQSSSFIEKRWLQDESFSSEHVVVALPRMRCNSLVSGTREQGRTAPQTFFWLGFVLGPWCWLIGGWVIANRNINFDKGKRTGVGSAATTASAGENVDEKEKGTILPLWMASKKKKSGMSMNWDSLRVYPFFAPPVDVFSRGLANKAPINAFPRTLQLPQLFIIKQKESHRSTHTNRTDTWVFRCRVAAIVSGILLITAMIALIIVAGLR